jgi:O-antigen/teichoic acid export membrane protein
MMDKSSALTQPMPDTLPEQNIENSEPIMEAPSVEGTFLARLFQKYSSSKSPRSAKAVKNIASTFLIKAGSIVINLALLPLTINYLSPAKYGVWLTVSSMLGWINFFDIGLGHGLRNKLAESIAKNDTTQAKTYVSTAYFSIGVLVCVLFGIFVVINQFLDWNHLLNIPVEIDENLKAVALILFSMFSIQFILQLINSILLSNQEPAKVSLNTTLSNLFVLIAVVLLVKFTKESLFHVAFVFSTIPVAVLAFMNIYYFRKPYKAYSPSLKSFNFAALSDVLSLGVKFFIIQISVLIFFQTSNLLICRYFSPEFVTPYNIAFRYFGIITMVFSIITNPYWSAYTEAYVKKDYVWMRKTVKQLFYLWVGMVVISVIMLLCSETVYRLWVGAKIKVDFQISLFMMLYAVIVSFGNIYIMILNGIGQIKLQMFVNIIGMLGFIPLTYYLAMTLHLGIVGIIISTIICSLYGPLIAPFEVRRMLRGAKEKL